MNLSSFSKGDYNLGVVEWIFSPVGTLSIGVELVLDHIDHDIITHEATLIHDLLGFTTQRCLLRNLGSQHVPSSLQ